MNVTATYNGVISTVTSAMNVGSEIRKMTTGVTDGDLDISPVTLSSAWSRVARLLLLASLAVAGSVGNVFMISAVVVEDQLNKRGTPSIFSFTTANKNGRGMFTCRDEGIVLAICYIRKFEVKN